MNTWLRDNLIRSALERLLPGQKREFVFGESVIACRAEGFTVFRNGVQRHDARWESIAVIIAHKRDLITMDLICFDVLLDDGRLIEVNEEMAGFDGLLSAMERNLDQFDRMWPDKVVEPPFVANSTVIYRGGAGLDPSQTASRAA